MRMGRSKSSLVPETHGPSCRTYARWNAALLQVVAFDRPFYVVRLKVKNAIKIAFATLHGTGAADKKEAACVATSGPSLGRKRPRRASAANLPHRNNIRLRLTEIKGRNDFFSDFISRIIHCYSCVIMDSQSQAARMPSISPLDSAEPTVGNYIR